MENDVIKKFKCFCNAQPKCEKCPLYSDNGSFCTFWTTKPWSTINEEQRKIIKSIIYDEETKVEKNE